MIQFSTSNTSTHSAAWSAAEMAALTEIFKGIVQ